MIFEVIQYTDGGPNDRGRVIAYVEGNTYEEAKDKFKPDCFQELYEISEVAYNERKLKAQQKLNKFII